MTINTVTNHIKNNLYAYTTIATTIAITVSYIAFRFFSSSLSPTPPPSLSPTPPPSLSPTLSLSIDLTGSGKTIRIYCKENNGSGDLVFACKMAATLKKIAPLSRVILHEISLRDTHSLENHLQRNPLPSVEFNSPISEEEKENPENTLIICGPVITSPLPKTASEISRQKNTWLIGEYSNSCGALGSTLKDCIYSSGLGEKEWGVFCSDKTQIIETFESPILQQIRNTSLNPTYFGYSYDCCCSLSFLFTCIELQKEKMEDFDVCIVGNRILDPYFFDGPVLYYLKEKAKELNHPIELIYNKNGAIEKITFNQEKEGKKVRLILPGTVSRQDVDKLISESHDSFTLATGDQSLSEQLGGIFMPETLGHKQASFRNLLNVAKTHNLNLFHDFLETSNFDTVRNSLQIKKNTAEIADLLKNPDLKEEAKKFGEIVKAEHNIENTLRINFQKWLQNQPI